MVATPLPGDGQPGAGDWVVVLALEWDADGPGGVTARGSVLGKPLTLGEFVGFPRQSGRCWR